jgi:transposase-like protein
MSKQRRSFKVEEKLLILKQAEDEGIKQTLLQHHLSYSVLSRWRIKLEALHRLNTSALNTASQQEFNLLIEENIRLRKIIAEQALELQINRERLNNNQQSSGKLKH